MIANGGRMKCGGICENFKLQMGHYYLKPHIFSINIDGCDIVLKALWLYPLGPFTMDLK
jgi:hypothetical protein